ncbi:hypothetical protein ACIPSE_46910 [Streptomyces sp. NPDC090106]|uniref:hypothetical protein n=1 Tax=Streptomyces sp. NPDC090106 TaxID=3365946 RepID=UPI003816B49C
MIIEFAGAGIEAGEKSFATLTGSWGYPPEPLPPAEPTGGRDDKGIDPVAVASLIVSVPSAMLAVADITDRILKRRRAGELIEHARQLNAQQTTVRLVREDGTIDLATLTPDQLLDLIANQDPTT